MAAREREGEIAYRPVTPERWPDLERLFAASAGEALGNPSRCWCMEWRWPSRETWRQNAGEGNRAALRGRIEAGDVPGLLAYRGREPVGWCSVAPRCTFEGFRALGAFRNPERPDVWSVHCFYVPERERGRGLVKGLLHAALAHAAAGGARIVEGYPPPPEAFGDGAGGSTRLFEEAGFVEVARFGPVLRKMRWYRDGAEARGEAGEG